jgi:hypothetical protein
MTHLGTVARAKPYVYFWARKVLIRGRMSRTARSIALLAGTTCALFVGFVACGGATVDDVTRGGAGTSASGAGSPSGPSGSATSGPVKGPPSAAPSSNPGPPPLLGPPPSAGPYDTCSAPSDCAWGEIPHEIASPADCMCLFGCTHLPQSQATSARRAAQYKAYCDPGKDGAGRPCAVDDCVGPPPITCLAGRCSAAPADAGGP